MAVDGQQLLKQGVAIFGPPDLAEAEEEALVAGIAANHRRRLALQRHLIGVIGDGEAGEVGDILAERELAVDLGAGQRLVGAVLGDHLVGQLLELGEDRKSTRLNSSHGYISYAVFCLKKKIYRNYIN